MLILRLLSQSVSASPDSKNFQDGVRSKSEIYRPFSQESSMIPYLKQTDAAHSELVGQRTITTPSGKIIRRIP